jgi:hypothetical protein
MSQPTGLLVGGRLMGMQMIKVEMETTELLMVQLCQLIDLEI